MICNNGFQNGTPQLPTVRMSSGNRRGKAAETRGVEMALLWLQWGPQFPEVGLGSTPRVSAPVVLWWDREYAWLASSWGMPELLWLVRVPHFETHWIGG